jgi:hypothetical protein
MGKTMLGLAKHAWSAPQDGAACSCTVARADVVLPGSGWDRYSHDDEL